MRIFRHEIAKVFLKKSSIVILLFSLILNGVLLWLNEDKKYKNYEISAYREICSDMSELEIEEAYDAVKTQRDKLDIISYIQIGMDVETLTQMYTNSDITEIYEEYSSGKFLHYTNSLFAEQLLYNDVLLEIESCVNYPQYLQNISETAEKITSASIFSEPDSFSYKNIVKTPKAYEKLNNIELEFGASRGIKDATSFEVTDIIAVLLMIGVIVTLISRERELSQLELTRSTYNGRTHLVTSKLGVGFLAALISEICLYAVNLTVSGVMYGFGDLSRSIQSVYGFTGCNFDITILEYFVLFMLAKFAVYLMITAIIFLIAVIMKRSSGVYIGIVLIMGLENVLYNTIDNSSYLSLLRNLNAVAFLNTYTIFEKYRNFNLFSEPINYVPVFIAGTLFTIVLCSVLSVIIFGIQKKTMMKNRLSFVAEKFRFVVAYRTSSIFIHECYKIFIGGKTLLILIAFGAISLYTYTPIKEEFQSYNDVYYKQYIMQYEGEYTDKKYEKILEDIEYFSKLEREFTESDTSNIYSVMSYREKLAPFEALHEIQAHAEYLSTLENGEFLYDSGYKMLTGAHGTEISDLILALTAMIMIIMCTVYAYSVEYETGIYVMLKCSYKGRVQTFTAKFFAAFIIVTVIFGITYFPQLFGILKAYGTHDLSASAQCMEHLCGVTSSISVMEYLIILYILRFILFLLSVLFIFIVSGKTKSFIMSLAVSSTVLLVPIILALLDVPYMRNILINHIISRVL